MNLRMPTPVVVAYVLVMATAATLLLYDLGLPLPAAAAIVGVPTVAYFTLTPKGRAMFRRRPKRPAPAHVDTQVRTTAVVRSTGPYPAKLTLQDLRRLVDATRGWPGDSQLETLRTSIHVTRADRPTHHR